MDRPSGVTVDRDGDIYVADRGNDRVQLFDCNGRFVEKFIGDATLSKQARHYMMSNQVALRLREMTSLEPQKRLRTPISVRTDGDGRMYVTDYGSDRIQVYRKEAIALGPDEIGAPRKSPTLYTQF
jgi:DNA-binding beta-propeller fold protein YncE